MASRKNLGDKVSFGRKLSDQLFGLIVGAVFSGLITLIVWGFAYFGWTDLALPQRFEFEKLDHLVRKSLPPNFSYASHEVNFRSNGEKSILIIGRYEEFWDFKKDKQADIILVIDKTKTEYKVSYKFEPGVYVTESMGKAYTNQLHVNGLEIEDISGDGREEAVLGWSVLGAHWNDPAVVVLTSSGKDVRALGIEKYQDPAKTPFEYLKVPFENQADKKKFTTVDTTYFSTKDKRLALIKRTDDGCYACEEDGKYTVQYFTIFGDKLSPSYSSLEDISYEEARKLIER